jgi:glyoxylase-like metal-dependent hydrolase (beta-lactamase superfamily II)
MICCQRHLDSLFRSLYIEVTVKSLAISLTLAVLSVTSAFAQMSQLVSENTTKISDHVWAIIGFPNIAIIVGSRATLVVDTGLGLKNGATIVRVAAKLAPNNSKLFLTTTHFHPEHLSGESAFPAGTILIRNTLQQQEIDQYGQDMINIFSGRSAQEKDLLAGAVLRPPDILFDQEATIDLGGVTARLLWLGEAHTKGDELTLVEPDRTLISGDVVQNKTMPSFFANYPTGTPTTWLAVLDKVAALNAAYVLPDHSPPGDGSLVAAERDLISDLRNRALALKRQGISVDEAGKQVSADLKNEHPDWRNTNAALFVARVYNDPQDPQ